MNKFLELFALFAIITILFTIPAGANASNPSELLITDRTDEKTLLSYDQVTALPPTNVVSDLYCYGALVTTGQWTGAKISDILNYVNADTTASSIQFTAQDGYSIAIPMETGLQPDVILAYSLDSNPLPENFRLVIPSANGNMWIAMVTSITVSDAGASNVQGNVGNPLNGLLQREIARNPSQNTQPTPKPSPKPSTPTPIPTNPATATPTIEPTSPNASLAPQDAAQPTFPYNTLFVIMAVAMGTLVAVSLIIRKQKKH
ncbi:MAG TPA: molybdopterin-dependent oxidoreductase [Candidatus Acidoferrales bacterium]|nr:molybdopterin-dependent oxidoreductase [Candidatus Acidoferrales bacterium]